MFFSYQEYKETCSLNSVLYLKQYEIAVADSLGRIKLWDTRNKNSRQCSMNLSVDGECSPTICLANHPNQQHLIAAGNLNGLIFIYDVRSQKTPVIMTHNHSQPSKKILIKKAIYIQDFSVVLFIKFSRLSSVRLRAIAFSRARLMAPCGCGMCRVRVSLQALMKRTSTLGTTCRKISTR